MAGHIGEYDNSGKLQPCLGVAGNHPIKMLSALVGLIALCGCASSNSATAPMAGTQTAATSPASSASTIAASQDDEIFAFEDRALDTVTATQLERFTSDADFKSYRRKLTKIAKQRSRDWISQYARPGQYAMQEAQLPCTPGVDCPDEEADAAASVVVTGSRISAPKSITNNQTSNVDEGDIVKQIGSFLLVLQDARIFSIDMRSDTLALADRMDVYRSKNSDGWYDEMLVQDNRILITAYSYEEEATELSVFALNRDTGKLAREGVFLITSDDYYDGDNYATRIVGDRLVIYTPYEVEDMESLRSVPVVRRWLPEAEHDDARDKQERGGTPLFRASDIHKPVQRTSQPTIHTISVCPLGPVKAGGDLSCRSEAFIAPQGAEMFVSTEDVFLWTWPGWNELDWRGDCVTATRALANDILPSTIFRVPVRGGEPTVMAAKGRPFDHFSMDSRDSEFRALVSWNTFRCSVSQNSDVAYVRLQHRLFTQEVFTPELGRITAMPSVTGRVVENRFADNWMVYGGRQSWSSYAPSKRDEEDDDWKPYESNIVAFDVKRPDTAKTFTLPQNVIRTERVGSDMMVVNGYRDASGLWTTLFRLSGEPQIADRIHYPGRFESEGRSHAFNGNVEDNKGGMFGIPTVVRDDESGRWWWRSERSDLSFVGVSAGRKLRDMGELKATGAPDADNSIPPWERRGEKHPFGYECEVSCVDWYGNTRPIFTEGRIFGLMETEIVEARVEGGKIAERHRLDMTHPVGTKAVVKPMLPQAVKDPAMVSGVKK